MAGEIVGPLVRRAGVEVREVPDGAVLYVEDRERVHFLNPTAVVVYELCDGQHDAAAIVAAVARTFELDTDPTGDVQDCLSQLLREGLVAPAGGTDQIL